MFRGTVRRCPNIRFVFSHGGGTMPSLVERFLMQGRALPQEAPDGALPILRSFYYDVAQASNRWALLGLTDLVSTGQILFGTDFPFRSASDHVKGLQDFGYSQADLKAIYRDNALKLLPQWR
jgi:predicted TIM-barrel fold metal-dependent hydrolase